MAVHGIGDIGNCLRHQCVGVSMEKVKKTAWHSVLTLFFSHNSVASEYTDMIETTGVSAT